MYTTGHCNHGSVMTTHRRGANAPLSNLVVCTSIHTCPVASHLTQVHPIVACKLSSARRINTPSSHMTNASIHDLTSSLTCKCWQETKCNSFLHVPEAQRLPKPFQSLAYCLTMQPCNAAMPRCCATVQPLQHHGLGL